MTHRIDELPERADSRPPLAEDWSDDMLSVIMGYAVLDLPPDPIYAQKLKRLASIQEKQRQEQSGPSGWFDIV